MTAAAPADPSAPRRRKRSAGEVLRALRRPKVAVMLGLGFSSGLPFLMIGNTLGYWLREGGIALAAIGFLSWAGLAYSFKFLFGAVLDRAPPPLWGVRLGRRRGWMLWTQLGVALGLVAMAASGPHLHAAARLGWLAAASILTGVSAATQDLVIDTWRIESAADGDELGLLTSAYSLTYRFAIICTDSVILWLAGLFGWDWSYVVFAGLMCVGVISTLCAREPAQVDGAIEARARQAPFFSARGAYDVVIEPFVAFFKTHGWSAALILLLITTYHLCDYLRGPLSNPYYVDLHVPKSTVAAIRVSFGLAATLTGVVVGGLFVLRFGYMRGLIVGGVIQPIAIALFSLFTYVGTDLRLFTTVMCVDGFSMAFAGVVLISYMSTLTSLGYTATQYALLSSAWAVTGKFLKGFSGVWVQELAHGGRDLLHAYALFYLYAAAVGIPALGLVLWVAAVERRRVSRVSVVPVLAPDPASLA